jgi:hypothetical protein
VEGLTRQLAERDQRLAELKRQVGNRGYHDEETNSKAGIKNQDDECDDNYNDDQ